jgi:hypothetical protein
MAVNRDLAGIGRNRSGKSERGLYGSWESLERGTCGKISTSEPLSILSNLPGGECGIVPLNRGFVGRVFCQSGRAEMACQSAKAENINDKNTGVALRLLRNQGKMLGIIPLVKTLNFIVHLLA